MKKENKKKNKTSLYKAFIPFATYKMYKEWEKEGHEKMYHRINAVVTGLSILPILVYAGASILFGSLNYTKWDEIANKREEIQRATIEKIADYHFREYDLDGDSFLSQEEFKNYNYDLAEKLKKVGTEWTIKEN